jgi:hypothetical protein
MSSTLNPTWSKRAQALNPVFQSKLGWTIPVGWPKDTSSVEFAQTVADFQGNMGLVPDGVIGPRTASALDGNRKQFATPVDHLVIGGQQISVPFPVVHWDDPLGLTFYGDEFKGLWAPRVDPRAVDLLVLHWDGCTSSHQCYQVLLERKLSVHLMLDWDGTVYQALDLASAKAYHAKGVNSRSVGIEICNPVVADRNRFCNPARALIVDAGVNGAGGHAHLDFYDLQKQRVIQIAEAISTIFNIPRRLPRISGGSVARDALAENDLVSFKGTVGHYHVSDSKDDPGMTLWSVLDHAGWA